MIKFSDYPERLKGSRLRLPLEILGTQSREYGPIQDHVYVIGTDALCRSLQPQHTTVSTRHDRPDMGQFRPLLVKPSEMQSLLPRMCCIFWRRAPPCLCIGTAGRSLALNRQASKSVIRDQDGKPRISQQAPRIPSPKSHISSPSSHELSLIAMITMEHSEPASLMCTAFGRCYDDPN